MKVLILSITAGYGHHATAHAVANALESRGHTSETVDLLKYISTVLYKTVDKGYEFSTKHFARQYGQAYSILEKNRIFRRNAVTPVITELMTTRFRKQLQSFAPDIVVCTHVFPAMVMDDLKRRGEVAVPVIGIVTDYTLHPFWDDVPLVEGIVIGSEYLSYRLEQKGIEKERILPFGIPVHPKYRTSVKKEEARETLGLRPDTFTLLCMSGSMGYGRIESVISSLDALPNDMQMLCVCGRNEEAYSTLTRMFFKKDIHVYGFVDNVDLMMDAADCVVTKPGGLTTTECLVKGLPMVFINPIPGQEQRNIDFFVNTGTAIRCTKDYLVDEAVYMLAENPMRLAQLREAVAHIARPDAADRLIDHMVELTNERTTL